MPDALDRLEAERDEVLRRKIEVYPQPRGQDVLEEALGEVDPA